VLQDVLHGAQQVRETLLKESVAALAMPLISRAMPAPPPLLIALGSWHAENLRNCEELGFCRVHNCGESIGSNLVASL
jgi:hypothetical protein